MSKLNSTLKRLAKDESGVTVVETALVILPFVVIVIGILDFGYRSYVDVVADSVAYRVAREATAGALTPDDVEDEVVRLINPLLLSGAMIDVQTRSYFDFTSVGRPEQISVDADGNGDVDEGDCFIDENSNANFDLDTGIGGVGGADDVVIYEISINSPNLTGISEFIGSSERGFSVTAQATGRNQPFATQAEPELREYCVTGGVNVPV